MDKSEVSFRGMNAYRYDSLCLYNMPLPFWFAGEGVPRRRTLAVASTAATAAGAVDCERQLKTEQLPRYIAVQLVCRRVHPSSRPYHIYLAACYKYDI